MMMIRSVVLSMRPPPAVPRPLYAASVPSRVPGSSWTSEMLPERSCRILCHSERSEETRSFNPKTEILRFAQNDLSVADATRIRGSI